MDTISIRRVSLCSVVANVLYSDIVVSEFELQSHYYEDCSFNVAVKNINPFIPPVKKYNYFYSTKMTKALNNPQMLICHETKKTI